MSTAETGIHRRDTFFTAAWDAVPAKDRKAGEKGSGM